MAQRKSRTIDISDSYIRIGDMYMRAYPKAECVSVGRWDSDQEEDLVIDELILLREFIGKQIMKIRVEELSEKKEKTPF